MRLKSVWILVIFLFASPVLGGEQEPTRPALHPAGARLETRQLGSGVYALVSSKPPVDNSGFVVGDRGVLVIDAHINGFMARQIQEAIRKVTDKPILYLVNTNYHGDHTFGNYAFPAKTIVIAHEKTAEWMHKFEEEKVFLLPTVQNDRSVFADVRLRLPDIVFEKSISLDLGDRSVEIHHFGAGNTQGDTVVYVPDARVAWTGNLVLGEGTIPIVLEGEAGTYLQTIARLADTLDVQTIVPGHGPLTTGATLGRYSHYLTELIEAVRDSIRSGQKPDELVARNKLNEEHIDRSSPVALAGLSDFLRGLHRNNLMATYQHLRQNQNR